MASNTENTKKGKSQYVNTLDLDYDVNVEELAKDKNITMKGQLITMIGETPVHHRVYKRSVRCTTTTEEAYEAEVKLAKGYYSKYAVITQKRSKRFDPSSVEVDDIENEPGYVKILKTDFQQTLDLAIQRIESKKRAKREPKAAEEIPAEPVPAAV